MTREQHQESMDLFLKAARINHQSKIFFILTGALKELPDIEKPFNPPPYPYLYQNSFSSGKFHYSIFATQSLVTSFRAPKTIQHVLCCYKYADKILSLEIIH